MRCWSIMPATFHHCYKIPCCPSNRWSAIMNCTKYLICYLTINSAQLVLYIGEVQHMHRSLCVSVCVSQRVHLVS
uniref:Phosphoglucan phosphatase LSF1ic-like isoform X2 n=1 Tax=Rhizophora mucronata TaxID=61149 RepID=A0A2P2LJ93_RHIMU